MALLVALAWLLIGSASAALAAGRRQVVYHSGSSPAGLWLMNADGGSPQSFIAGASGATYSADGSKLAYQVGGSVACNLNFGPGQIVAANVDGSQPVTIGSGCSPRISPDGTRVLYLGPVQNGVPEPVLIAALSDPTHPRQILPFAHCDAWVTTTYPSYPNNQSVCDINQIAAWIDNNNIVVSGYQNGLWVLPAAGGNPHPILSGSDQSSDWYNGLSVSPDASTIAGYPLSQTAGTFVLTTVPASGGSLKALFAQNASDAYTYPQWFDNQTLVVNHVSGPPAHVTSRVAVTPAIGFSPKDLNPADISVSFPALGYAACSLGSAARDVRATERTAAASSSCGLDVTAAPTKRTITSGLSPDDFGSPGFTGGAHDTCVSGCTTVVVTVKDQKTHKRVKGAIVSASVTPISDPSVVYASGHPDSGYLCDARVPTHCGKRGFHEVTGLKTNAQGQVKLIFWAPGVVRDESTVLTVMAKEACSPTACPLGQKTGEATPNPTLTVKPNTIYLPRPAKLTLAQATLLAEWTNHAAARALGTHTAIALLEEAVKTMIESELLSEVAGSVTGGILNFAHLAIEEKHELEFMAIFVDAFHLREAGLGDGNDHGLVFAQARRGFVDAFAGSGGVFGGGGLLWRYGQLLDFFRQRHELRAQDITLQVFEVSYCQQGARCGPGYQKLNRRHPGIRPYLYIELIASQAHPFHAFSQAIVVPYNAHAWMRVQLGE